MTANSMASFVVSPVIARILHTCASLIHGKQFPLFSNYEEELENISRSLVSVQHNVTAAEENQHIDEALKHWLSMLTEAAYDAEHELDTIATEFQLMVGGEIPQIDLSRLQKISHRIETISEEKQRPDVFFPTESSNSRLQGTLGTDCMVDTGVFGRERETEEIVDLLLCEKLDKNVDVIGINGTGGVGKTTLAHLVLNDERVKRCFQPHIIWVSLAHGCTLPGILQGLKGFSHIPCPESQSSTSTETAFKEFVAGKRFLIILDNLSFKDKQDQIRLLQLLELGIKGSKLLYTSRSPLDIDGETNFLVKPLSTENCWSLFRKIAFEGGKPHSSDLEEMGKAIVDKCQGSPLSVKVLASLLRGNTDLQDWRTIKESNMWTLDLPALQISFYNLPCHLKECLILCSSFPKDHMFNKKELAKIWMAQGFIPMGEEDDAEEIGLKYIEEFLKRCFFQPFKNGDHNGVQCTMHGVIHDLAQSSSGFLKNRHLLEMIDDQYAWHVREEVFFRQNASVLKYMRVLDLSWSRIFSLASSIGECKLLRYIDLSSSSVFGLPGSVCDLCNLQTLRLLDCVWLEDLPRNLYKLSKLRHLEMDKPNWRFFYGWPEKLGKLTDLRTLSAHKVGVGSGCGIEELKDLENLAGSLHIGCLENAENTKEANLKFKKLRKLDFEWSEEIKNKEYKEESYLRILEDLSPNENIVELVIGNYRSYQFPNWMTEGVVLQKLEVLTLNNCTRFKVLEFDFPSLRKLSLKGMEELEEISKLKCPTLKELEMVECGAIHSFPEDGVPASVEFIKIQRCWKLYDRCQRETGPEWPKIAHIPCHQICQY